MKAWKTLIVFTIVIAFSFVIPCSAYADALVSVPGVSGNPGEDIIIPINIDDATGVAGGTIVLTFDADILTATGAQTTSLSNGFTLLPNPIPGQITIGLMSATGIESGSGALIEVLATVNQAAPPLQLYCAHAAKCGTI